MFREMKFVPTTETSKPFVGAKDRCGFDKLGYVEDEYFLSGTANVYDEDPEHKVHAVCESAPYTTRVMIRRPESVEKFSGNVVIEVVNSTANMDIDRMWISTWPYLTRNGDIYIGISSKGNTVDALKTYDPERYAPINWANPTPDKVYSDEILHPHGYVTFMPQYETGLFWDMLIDLVELLRSDREENPLSKYGKKWLYLAGWSQSTGYVNRFITSFAYDDRFRKGGAPFFDGYVAAGGAAWLAPLNNEQIIDNGKELHSGVAGAREPLMIINTESENTSAFWYGDFDEPEFKARTWQLAGTSHDSQYTLLDYYGDEDLSLFINTLGRSNNKFTGVEGEALEVLYDFVFCAAMKALYLWAREGMPAPHAPKIETFIARPENPSHGIFDSRVTNLTDAFGNCRGGIRVPSVVYPTARYQSYSVNEDGVICQTFGTAFPFSATLLQELYGDAEHYRALLDTEYSRLVAQGFALEGDRTCFLDYSVGVAKKRGLR